MDKTGCVLLLSGGLDSALCLAMEVRAERTVLPIFFDYGQPQLTKERFFVGELTRHYGLAVRRIRIEPLESNSFRDYFMRNLILLSYAVNIAAGSTGFARVVSGIRKSIYPDTSDLFVSIFNSLAWTLSHERVFVQYPIFWLSKRAVFKKARKLGLPIWLTYSCIRGTVPCGECASCRERIRCLAWEGGDM